MQRSDRKKLVTDSVQRALSDMPDVDVCAAQTIVASAFEAAMDLIDSNVFHPAYADDPVEQG